MYRAIIRAFVILILLCSTSGVSTAYEGSKFITINGIDYSDEDFKHWWSHWNDDKKNLDPSTPDDFVAFMLFVQQGEEMGYDSQPNYLHKLEVFLQVRALMELKYEEVDSKAVVTEADLRKNFDDNFGTVWSLQILGFDSEAKARKAYEAMLPYNGQIAGQLVFADWHGGNAEDKADTYDEVKVVADDFHKNKKDSWLSVVRNLNIAEVSKPFLFEDNNKYILIRLIDKKPAGDSVFEEKRQKISEQLFKSERAKLTGILISKLQKKYDVKIDQDLVKSIKFDIEYPNDLLDRKVITSSFFDATVRDMLFNIKKEKVLRKDISDDDVKELVINSLLSQTLVNKESLQRGYENRPPLKWTYDFYKQNRLRLEVETGLMSSVVLSEQDIQNYYDLHGAEYSTPEKVSYVLVAGDEDVLKKVWIGALQGVDFNELMKKFQLNPDKTNSDVSTLPLSIRNEINKLSKGDVGVPFRLDSSYALIKLIDRISGQVVPLQQVRNKVSDRIKKDKFEVIKTEYLNKLKSKSEIIINDKVWNSLVRELANGKK